MRFVAAVALAAGVLALPAAAAEQKAIAAAIKNGAEFLRVKYSAAEINPANDENGLGQAALCGLAMLEGGVKADDKAMQTVANLVRTQSLLQVNTYHISLCIIFLDRYGEKTDVPLIQTLGVRLYSGMNSGGGWTYRCWENTAGADALLKSLQTNELTTKPEKPADPPKKDDFFQPPPPAKMKDGAMHPVAGKLYADVAAVLKARGRGAGVGPMGDDNSNTQFGIVGLWVAARHGVPAADAFATIEARFIRSQNRDGGWSYTSMAAGSSVSMTCAGLLGLAVGRVSRETQLVGEKKDAPKKDPPPDDPFFTPKKGDGEKADPLSGDKPKAKGGANEKSTEAGLNVLAAAMATAQQAVKNRGVPGNPLSNLVAGGNILYMLWSVERVCVAYSLDTIGGVDWYQLGADSILSLQAGDGSFTDSNYGAEVNTAFAILFLCKANFTKELGIKIKAKDPGKGELRGGGGGTAPLYSPPSKEPTKTGPPPVDPEKPGTGGFSLPKVTEPTEQGEAEKVSDGLVKATDGEWAKRLEEARDTKGAKWTRGLVLACGKLDGDKRYQAREALADRLTRMTPRTLREMLKDPELEVRRAACLACGMKEDRSFAPDLIARLTDPSEYVVRAARAALKSMAEGNDFGPANAADDDAKIQAAAKWSAWFNQK